jgi:hypothetical protein
MCVKLNLFVQKTEGAAATLYLLPEIKNLIDISN